MTRSELIRTVTEDYLEEIKQNPPPPDELQAQLLERTNLAIEAENAKKPKSERWRKLADLELTQISQIMLSLHPIIRVRSANSIPKYDLLAVYMKDGENMGIYDTEAESFNVIAKSYNRSLKIMDCKEITADLKEKAPRAERCRDEDLIAVNNGIFNYRTKQLLPFSKNYIFLSKSRVNYNPYAANVVIHNDADGTDWDVESWMKELSDDEGIVNLLWEIMGAVIRPHVHWNKSAWFYSESGNNGKGTLCSLMRNLCGSGTYASIPLSDFGKEFMLEPLIHASAIIVDENDVGGYIDRAANLKAIITNDVIQLNRKHQSPVSYQFFGFMVQCLNEMPRIRDRSDSFYRRQLFVPFTKCFTGHERRYIKADYLKRKEVLEYVLARVLHMNYYELSEPEACRNALAEYKEFNDPIRQFMTEMEQLFVWDLLPFGFLYDLYRAWFRQNFPSGTVTGRNSFIRDLVSMIGDFPEWHCPGRNVTIRPAGRMDAAEPMIAEYNLVVWMNPLQRGRCSSQNLDVLCRPLIKTGYNGLLRRVPKLTGTHHACTGSNVPDIMNTDPETGIIGGK